MEGLILSSPAVKLKNIGWVLRVFQRLLLWVAPHKSLDMPNDKGQVCSDPVFVQRYWADPLCHRCASAAFLEAFRQGREEILNLGHELDRPILLLESGNDTVVDPDASEELWAGVRPGLLERHRMEGFKHEIFHDLRRAEALALTQTWLSHFPDGQSRNPSPASATTV
jgi:alpha-beta hydrolase superfamily lysophospholipase